MIRTNISSSGVELGKDTDNLSYLYGLGDFFSVMFEDTSLPNLLLESTTLTASEVYSQFLQLTSTLSIEGIQTTTGSQLKLVLLNSSSLVPGTPATYVLQDNVTSSRYVANRPLAPTELLESDVDFSILQDSSGSSTITFAKPITEYAISSRLLQDGVTTQYAIWLVDANIDNRLLTKYYGNLLGVSPENSSEQFANFLYGLYYVYTNGPTLSTIRKGLNLVLGVPLARLDETVIDVRTYLQTDQYLVVTDQNQYLLPFGLTPSVAVGDSLVVGEELARWVEVKDYVHDGDWWYNMYIPKHVIPDQPSGQLGRRATPGSSMDYLMRNYLKDHTFLVNVNVTSFKNVQQFSQLFDIIRKAKPAYTQPIYVWSVLNEESVVASDDETGFQIQSFSEENTGDSYVNMRRDSVQPLLRGTSRFIRFNAPKKTDFLLGYDEDTNSSDTNSRGLTVSGYGNLSSQYRRNTYFEATWLYTLGNRASDTWRGSRNTMGYRRGVDPTGETGHSYEDSVNRYTINNSSYYGKPKRNIAQTNLYQLFSGISNEDKVVPIAVLSQSELEEKCSNLGLAVFSPSTNYAIIHGSMPSSAINKLPVLGRPQVVPSIRRLYPQFFTRDSDLPVSLVSNSFTSKVFSFDPLELTEFDSIVLVRVDDNAVSVLLLSRNKNVHSPAYYPVEDSSEVFSLQVQGVPTRGLATSGSPYYQSRGSVSFTKGYPSEVPNGLNYSDSWREVPESTIESAIASSDAIFNYSDSYNESFPRLRGGTSLINRAQY